MSAAELSDLTAQQREALRALADGRAVGYWSWRSRIRPFRQATKDRLIELRLIEISDGYVKLTSHGRELASL